MPARAITGVGQLTIPETFRPADLRCRSAVYDDRISCMVVNQEACPNFVYSRASRTIAIKSDNNRRRRHNVKHKRGADSDNFSRGHFANFKLYDSCNEDTIACSISLRHHFLVVEFDT